MTDKKLLGLSWEIPDCNSGKPLLAKIDGVLDIKELPFINIPFVPSAGLSCPDHSFVPEGFELEETFWVDNTIVFACSTLAKAGWQFLEKIKAGKYYAVIVNNSTTIHVAAFNKL